MRYTTTETGDIETGVVCIDHTEGVVFTAAAHFDTRDEADAFIAQFPKSHKWCVLTCEGTWRETGEDRITYTAETRTTLRPTKGNAVNETGERRVAAIRKALAAVEVEIHEF